MDELFQIHMDVLSISYVSFMAYILLFICQIFFADTSSWIKKIIVGFFATTAHSIAAFSMLIIFESLFQAATDGYVNLILYLARN